MPLGGGILEGNLQGHPLAMSGGTVTSLDDLKGILAALRDAAATPLGRNTFENRLTIQKAVYLLKALGDKRAEPFHYNYYFRGPYSQSLTKVYYQVAESHFKPSPDKAGRPADPRIAAVADAVDRGPKFLEAAATLQWVRTKNPTLSEKRAVEFAQELKPALADRFAEALLFLEQVGLAK
jgi:uncharacterized protein YwgA